MKRTCIEDRDVFIDDGAIVKIFNCTAYEKVANTSLQAFLKYVQNNRAESDFTRRIADMVEAQKELEATKKVYFTWSLHDHDVRKHGREEGREEAKIEAARKLLAMGLGTHEQIAEAEGLPLEKIEELAAEMQIHS